jgi:hypothetical protein
MAIYRPILTVRGDYFSVSLIANANASFGYNGPLANSC